MFSFEKKFSMNKYLSAITVMLLFSIATMAQDGITVSLKTAQEQYTQKKLMDAQTSITKALNDVNTMLGAQVIVALPVSGGDFTTDGESDSNGQQGMEGACPAVNVTRQYLSTDGDESLQLNISMNSITANNIRGAINQGISVEEDGMIQKIVLLGTLRALMVWDVESNTGDIETAKGNVFAIFTGDGFANPDAFVAAASKIDFTKAMAVLGQ
jgi:hypothetical protein